MSRRARRVLAASLMAAGFAASAAAAGNSQPTTIQDTHTQATHTQALDRAHAQQWHLSIQQWDRYRHLMQGIDGYRSDKLDPITELGIRARSATQRTRYARKLAQLEHDRVQRVLDFQHAYDAAWKQLYPNEQPIKAQHLASALDQGRRSAQRLGLAGGLRTTVFVRTHDCAACQATIKRLAASHTPMDIYVVDDAGNDDAIRRWAQQIGLNPQRVRAGDITLNHAPAAAMKQLAGQSLPRVVSR